MSCYMCCGLGKRVAFSQTTQSKVYLTNCSIFKVAAVTAKHNNNIVMTLQKLYGLLVGTQQAWHLQFSSING